MQFNQNEHKNISNENRVNTTDNPFVRSSEKSPNIFKNYEGMGKRRMFDRNNSDSRYLNNNRNLNYSNYNNDFSNQGNNTQKMEAWNSNKNYENNRYGRKNERYRCHKYSGNSQMINNYIENEEQYKNDYHYQKTDNLSSHHQSHIKSNENSTERLNYNNDESKHIESSENFKDKNQNNTPNSNTSRRGKTPRRGRKSRQKYRNEKQQLTLPLPSNEIKREPTLALPSTDKKIEPLLPLPPKSLKKEPQLPLSAQKIKKEPLPLSSININNELHLSSENKKPANKDRKSSSSSESSSSSDSSSSSESTASKHDTKAKQTSNNEEEIICLGNPNVIHNLTNETSSELNDTCILCDKKGHTSFNCFMECRNCGEKYHNLKMCAKPTNLSIMLQTFMEFCLEQCSQYNPEQKFSYIRDNKTSELIPLNNSRVQDDNISGRSSSKKSKKRRRKRTSSESDSSNSESSSSSHRKISKRKKKSKSKIPYQVPFFPSFNPLAAAAMMGFNPTTFMEKQDFAKS